MGGADFINILYTDIWTFDPDDMQWFFRDRFFLDPGHMSPMLYSVLALCGKYSRSDLEQFRQWKSPTPGHPEVDFARGVENTSGPLGQGHTNAVGAAIAERFLAHRFGEWTSHNIYAFISDGSIQEEISQGAGRIAGHLGLDNLVMFYDSNDIQLSTETEATTSEDTAKKYEAWGWATMTIDGNDAGQIRKALDAASQESERPFLIIGKTAMGKGLLTAEGKSFERQSSTHGQPVSKAGADVEKSLKALGADPADPFAVFKETQELYEEALEDKRKAVAEKRKQEQAWRKENPAKAEMLDKLIAGELTKIDYAAVPHKENLATRAASGNVLAHFAEKLDNILVASADLANSDKTDGFLKKTQPVKRNDFSGAFLHAGVSEITMGAIAKRHRPAWRRDTGYRDVLCFFRFMKPAIRLAALMELPVKYVFTHDAFRVGEDGPTHQPVEQEAQLRLLEKLRNHSGERSMLVLRPADSAETKVAWKMAMENKKTPTALVLSRQGIQDIAPMGDDRFAEAHGAEKGAYLVRKADRRPDVVLVGNGSEVSTLLGGADILKKEGFMVNVASAPSPNLFFDQDEAYRESVIPSNVPVFGLSAGLPDALEQIAGKNGKVIGLEHFGYSAPYNVLDEKFGYTAENVAEKVRVFLK
ncbi:MAG: transketolase C-terminal domain-containing protein [Bacteroidales bacterium]|nr:transketolase C-terminal domain-containing protein [Bacteroidales bacterium]